MNRAVDPETTHAESGTARSTGPRPGAGPPHAGSLPGYLLKLLLILGGLALLILALRLMTTAAGGIGPLVIARLHIRNPVNTLGFGWLFAYAVLSGTPVVGVAFAFFAGGVLTPTQTFTMISGSRLGADMIVFFIGFLYYLRGHPRATSISMGVIAQTVTATTYLPALPLGYWLLRSHVLDRVRFGLPAPVAALLVLVFDPIVAFLALHLNGWLVFFLGVGAILLAFRSIDHGLPQLGAEHRAFGRIGKLVYRPLAMFALGMAVTLVGMSVSVSISLLVPLSARGLIRRDNTVPYILGTNIATLIDKLLPALLVNRPLAVTIILVEVVSVSAVSLTILLFFYRPYERMILNVLDWVVASNRGVALFLTVMVAVPIVLLLV